MANILLLGAGGNAGINFTKCVQKAGHTVFGLDANKYYLASSNCNVKITDVIHTDTSLLDLVSHYRIDMIHAQPDILVKWLLERSESFEGYLFGHDSVTWSRFSNKLFCQEIWSKTITPFEAHSFLECCLKPILFEKMRHAGAGKVWIRAVSGAGSKAALPITSFSQAENWVSYWEEARGMNKTDFMLSEFLPGKEYAVQTFWHKGDLIHSQARERLIYFFGALMPSGQTSTPAVAKTIDEKRVYTTAVDAILAVDPQPHGIYCLDMKENSRGELVPTEVNYGRFFTTSDFFASMGVNTPAEYVRSFTEKHYKPDFRINYLNPNYYWIRGLDKEPKLIKYD